MNLPDGLAAGKTRIFQVNLPEDGAYAVFEYYTEYGDQCVAHLWLSNEKGLELECYLPVKALMSFVDHFREMLAGNIPACSKCGEQK